MQLLLWEGILIVLSGLLIMLGYCATEIGSFYIIDVRQFEHFQNQLM
jgi:hypothetical protein